MRPTITLALIAKNEEKNIGRLLDSVDGCFDEIILVDTGSTDRTKEIAEARGCKVSDFVWVDSFCKARNFAFSQATCDYVAWLDCDDVLWNREAFINWRDTAMEFRDFWFATYHYALDADGKPVVSFVRERVVRRALNPTWQFDLHEGIVPPAGARTQIVPEDVWAVKHMRDAEDMKADRSRNIRIIEAMKHPLEPRMNFYLGKELFEDSRPAESLKAFDEALASPKLESHDRVLSCQHAAYAAMALGDELKDEFQEKKHGFWQKAAEYALQGLKTDPNRAEFHVIIGDAYLKMGRILHAVPHYAAAKVCTNMSKLGIATPIYSYDDMYGKIPQLQLAKCLLHLQKPEEALKEAEDCAKTYDWDEAHKIAAEIRRMIALTKLDNGQAETEDIVFTAPPTSAYEFDEELYKVKGMGGSETALIHMAKQLKAKTGRNVLVYAQREKDLVCESGVEYRSNRSLNEYLSKNRPKVHIAWRHNIHLTLAPTYLWAHDLITPTVERNRPFKKMMVLSPFHRDYTKGMSGVPDEQLYLTRNGLDPAKYAFERKTKDPNKLVWMSSPDRGLDRCMRVLDEVRKTHPDVQLYVYYGLENLYKYGLADMADMLKAMMAERPWVHYMGFTEQNQMFREVSDAVVWPHTADFIETFCLTALEMLALGVYPVTRRLGALADTLADAESKGQAVLLDHDAVTEEEIAAYAEEVRAALDEKKWERIDFDPEALSWAKVADEWVAEMGL